jgi:hypothetical protein
MQMNNKPTMIVGIDSSGPEGKAGGCVYGMVATCDENFS